MENYIGMAQIPIGVAGPLLINGAFSKGIYYIPLATTEGALVASYNRGIKACLLSGGITAVCLTELVQRSPLFKFEDIFTVGRFIVWIDRKLPSLKEYVAHVSRSCKTVGCKNKFRRK